jgi:hypothetical protein
VSSDIEDLTRTGSVRRPTLFGALLIKAASTTIAVRANPERDWQDAALALTMLSDPLGALEECDQGDRRKLKLLAPLLGVDHPAWASFRRRTRQAGQDALTLLLD